MIGRNGKGKTTFLNLSLGRYQFKCIITKSVEVDHFPFLKYKPTIIFIEYNETFVKNVATKVIELKEICTR